MGAWKRGLYSLEFDPVKYGLVSWWQLDDLTGDKYGTNTLTNNGGVTKAAGPNAVLDSVGSFASASSQNLSIASNASVQTGNISWWLAVWGRILDKSDNRPLVAKDVIVSAREYNLIYAQGADRFSFDVANGATTLVGVAPANTLGSPTIGTWYFLFGYLDIVAGTVSISVNGGVFDTAALTGTPGTTNSAFRIGEIETAVPAFMNGQIAAVAMGKLPNIGNLAPQLNALLYHGGMGRRFPFALGAA